MLRPCTAILHLRECRSILARGLHHALREKLQGVNDVTVDARDSFVTVDFDRTTTGLAEIVRVLEEHGLVVHSVAERPAPRWP